MAKQRDKIRMSDAEIDALMQDCKSLQVATLNQDGSPHLTTLWFAKHDGNVVFETYGKSQKVVNLKRDPRISVLCEAGTTYDQLRGVSISGRAEIVDDEPRLSQLMAACIAKNHPGLKADQIAEQAKQMARKRVAIVVHPDKVISWDHRKLAAG